MDGKLKMTRTILSEKAKSDLLEIWLHIAPENLSAADNLIDTIEQKVLLLGEHPEAGRIRPELGQAVRSFDVGAGSYIIFYRQLPGVVEVARVLHGARDIVPELVNG